MFTGWNFAQAGTPMWNSVTPDWRDSMVNQPAHHDASGKFLLGGKFLPAGQTAAQDLRDALDNIFQHPNVGPFVCRQLIQRLVTSNPSPGYLYRVASVFNDNGQSVCGDLRAVIRAILLDPDARGDASPGASAGRAREPLLRVTALLRAFHASSPSGRFQIGYTTYALGQTPFSAPDVFSFFSPDYAAPGAIAAAGLVSPELQITTEMTAITTANYLQSAIYSGLGSAGDTITLEFAPELALSGDSAALVDHLNLLLTANNLSADARNIVIGAIAQIPDTNPLERVRTAAYLIVNTPAGAI